jgi:DNA polymerase II small subunit
MVEFQESDDRRLERALTRIISAGYQVDKNTLLLLKELVSKGILEEVVENAIKKANILQEKPFFLTRELIEESLPKLKVSETNMQESVAAEFTPPAKDIESRIEVLDDLIDEGVGEGVEGFISYFRDRFERVSSVLRRRSDAKDAVPIREVLDAPVKTRRKIIGIVSDKRERGGTIVVELEDLDDRVTIIVSSSIDNNAYKKAQQLFLDQVICVEATKIRDDLFIANDFIYPDVPDRKPNFSNEEVYMGFLSDTHIGSKKFLEKNFKCFFDWLTCKKGNSQQRHIAGSVKYLVIAGDLVDGIGVYPAQERELAIKDVYEQYSAAGRVLSSIPDYVKVILIPGNHDATCQALPQAPISDSYLKPVKDNCDVVSLGNPARLRIHGVEVLIYHGRSLDDVIGAIPEVTYQNLDKKVTIAMRALLRARHLAPIYGARTPIALRRSDRLVVDTPPDILHCGHIHVVGYEMYRGTLLVNSGTWQGQTEYQVRTGLTPTPAIVPLVNLSNFATILMDFSG